MEKRAREDNYLMSGPIREVETSPKNEIQSGGPGAEAGELTGGTRTCFAFLLVSHGPLYVQHIRGS